MEYVTKLKDGTIQDASPELIEGGPEPFYDIRNREQREALLRKYPITEEPREPRPQRRP